MTSCGDDYYEVDIPSSNYVNVIFCRMNPSATENNWDNKWNQTSDLDVDEALGGGNAYEITGWDKLGHWFTHLV